MSRPEAQDVLAILEPALAALPAPQGAALRIRARQAHACFPGHVCSPPCHDEPVLLLLQLAMHLDAPRGLSVLWLVFAARLPSKDQLDNLRWQLPRNAPFALAELIGDIEDLAVATAVDELRVLPPGTLLVDVTQTLRDPWYLTGIQRVVRGFLSSALGRDDLQLVHVDEEGRLVAVEAAAYLQRLDQGASRREGTPADLRQRLVSRGIALLLFARRPLLERLKADRQFATHPVVKAGRRAIRRLYREELRLPSASSRSLVVADGCTLLLIEVHMEASGVETLLKVTQQQGTRLAVVFYDAIPLSHPHYYQEVLLAGYLRYTRLLAAADVVLAISETSGSAARALRDLHPERSGRNHVQVVPLATGGLSVTSPGEVAGTVTTPLLLCVSSLEPRKNHVRLLRAATLVHRRGVEFHLILVAGSSWLSERIDRELTAAREAGLDVQVRRSINDEQLSALYTRARAAVFVSEVEGFGLPVAEALSHGTPVVCSDTGSIAEVAAAGGCLSVSAHDELAIADALERVLSDDVLHQRLTDEALLRPIRSWDDYADELLSGIQDRFRTA